MQAVSASTGAIKNFSYALTLDKKIASGLGLVTANDVNFAETEDPRFTKSRINPKKHPKEYLEDQKERLLFDIDKLTNQISTLTTKKQELKTLISKQSIGEVGRLQAQVLYSTTKAEELGDMRQQVIDNAHKIDDLKELTSSDIINYLTHEIKVLNHQVEELNETNKKDGEKIKYLRDKIDEIVYSELYDEIHSQKKKIAKLKSKLRIEVENYQKLKQDVYFLQAEKEMPSPMALEYTHLKKQLKLAQQKYKNSQNRYLELRQQQIDEFKITQDLITRMRADEDDTRRDIVVSNLPSNISTKLLHLMFETCGKIESLTIMNDNDADLTSAEITFSKHSEAVSAICNFDDKEIEDQKTLSVYWLQKKNKN